MDTPFPEEIRLRRENDPIHPCTKLNLFWRIRVYETEMLSDVRAVRVNTQKDFPGLFSRLLFSFSQCVLSVMISYGLCAESASCLKYRSDDARGSLTVVYFSCLNNLDFAGVLDNARLFMLLWSFSFRYSRFSFKSNWITYSRFERSVNQSSPYQFS